MERWEKARNFGADARCETPDVWPAGPAALEEGDGKTWLVQDFELELPVTVALADDDSGEIRRGSLRVRQTVRVRIPLDAAVRAGTGSVAAGPAPAHTAVTRRFSVMVPVTADLSGEA